MAAEGSTTEQATRQEQGCQKHDAQICLEGIAFELVFGGLDWHGVSILAIRYDRLNTAKIREYEQVFRKATGTEIDVGYGETLVLYSGVPEGSCSECFVQLNLEETWWAYKLEGRYQSLVTEVIKQKREEWHRPRSASRGSAF